MKPNHHLLIDAYTETLLTLSEEETNKLIGKLDRRGRGRPSTYKSARIELSFLSRFEESIRVGLQNLIPEDKLKKVFNKLLSIDLGDTTTKLDEVKVVDSIKKAGLSPIEAFQFTVVAFSLYFKKNYSRYIGEYLTECARYRDEIEQLVERSEELHECKVTLDKKVSELLRYERKKMRERFPDKSNEWIERALLEYRKKYITPEYEKNVNEKKKVLRLRIKSQFRDELEESGWINKYSYIHSIIERLISLRIQNGEVKALPDYVKKDQWEYFLHSHFSVAFESRDRINNVKDSRLIESWIKKQISPDRESLCNLAIILRWSEDRLNRLLNCYGHRTLVLRNPEDAILQWALVQNEKSKTTSPFVEYITVYCRYKIGLIKSLSNNEVIADGKFEELSNSPLSVFPMPNHNFLPSENKEKIENWNSVWRRIEKRLPLYSDSRLREIYYEEGSLSSEEKTKYDRGIGYILGPYNPKRNEKKRKDIKVFFNKCVNPDISLEQLAFECGFSEREYLVLKPIFDFEDTCDFRLSDIDFLICYKVFPSNRCGYERYIEILNKLNNQRIRKIALKKKKQDMDDQIQKRIGYYFPYSLVCKDISKIDEECYSTLKDDQKFLDLIQNEDLEHIHAVKDKILIRNLILGFRERYEEIFENRIKELNKKYCNALCPYKNVVDFTTSHENTTLFDNLRNPDYISNLQKEYIFSILSDYSSNNGQNSLVHLSNKMSIGNIQRIIKEDAQLKKQIYKTAPSQKLIKLFSIHNIDTYDEKYINSIISKLDRNDFTDEELVELKKIYFEHIRDGILNPLIKMVCINNYILKAAFFENCPLYVILCEIAKKQPVSEDGEKGFTTVCVNIIANEKDPEKFAEILSKLDAQFDVNRESSRRETARLMTIIPHKQNDFWEMIQSVYGEIGKIKNFSTNDFIRCATNNIILKNIVLKRVSFFSESDIKRIEDILEQIPSRSRDCDRKYSDLEYKEICSSIAKNDPLFLALNRADQAINETLEKIGDALEMIFFDKAEPSLLLLRILADLAGEDFKKVRHNAKFSEAELDYEELEDVFYYIN